MEFEGEVLQPNVKAKEKQWRMILEEKDRQIVAISRDVDNLTESLAMVTAANLELKQELQTTKERFRNFRASVKTRTPA